MDGKAGKVVFLKEYDKLEYHEKEAIRILSEKHGFSFTVPEEFYDRKNIDFDFNGVLWELKSVRSSNNRLRRDRINEAYIKFQENGISDMRLIYHNLNDSYDETKIIDKVLSYAKEKGFCEILFITNQKKVLRFYL